MTFPFLQEESEKKEVGFLEKNISARSLRHRMKPWESDICIERNDLRVVPFRLLTNLNYFYPVAERAQAHKSRLTGFGSEQPECVERKRQHSNFAPRKHRGKIPLV